MWLWLLITLSLDSFATPSSNGPATTEEAHVLWQDARQETQGKEFKEAVPKLQRLIDRYPSYEGFTEAHFLLGSALLSLGRPSEAQAPLRYYIQALGKTPEANRARLRLAEAYLDTRKFQEALLIALELERQGEAAAPREVALSGQLFKAQALHGLGHLDKALKLLETTRTAIHPEEKTLLAQASEVALELKLSDCSRLPGPRASQLDEAQMKNVFERRGTCLSESLMTLRELLQKGNQKQIENAARLEKSSFDSYLKACSSPVFPHDRRSAKEKSQYVAELMILLRNTCRSALDKNFELLQSMKDDIPESSLPIRKRVLDGLEKARKEFGSI